MKKQKKIKAWAVVKDGKIMPEDYYARETFRPYKSLAVFSSKKNLKGYIIYPEKIVPIEIIIKENEK